MVLCMFQAVVATAKRKWGSLEVFHQHQAAAQQQEAERQYMWMHEPKRQCLDREAQDALHWLWEETDYRELEQQVCAVLCAVLCCDVLCCVLCCAVLCCVL